MADLNPYCHSFMCDKLVWSVGRVTLPSKRHRTELSEFEFSGLDYAILVAFGFQRYDIAVAAWSCTDTSCR